MIAKKNMAASVRQRLLNKSRIDKRPFAELLQYYGMERFLSRLSQSEHAQAFVLKGALLLRTWGASMSPPTMDIDLLGRTSNEISTIKSQITDVIDIDLDDGLSFDTESVQEARITEVAEYEGSVSAFLDTLKQRALRYKLISTSVTRYSRNPRWWNSLVSSTRIISQCSDTHARAHSPKR